MRSEDSPRRVANPGSLARGTTTVAITRDEVRRVAALARLRLEPAEEERLMTDLDHILHAFERLQAVDTTDVPPTAHVEDFGALLRADEVLNPHGDEAAPGQRPGARRALVPRAEDHRVTRSA